MLGIHLRIIIPLLSFITSLSIAYQTFLSTYLNLPNFYLYIQAEIPEKLQKTPPKDPKAKIKLHRYGAPVTISQIYWESQGKRVKDLKGALSRLTNDWYRLSTNQYKSRLVEGLTINVKATGLWDAQHNGLQTRRREKKENKLNATPTTFSTKNNQF
jgi:hypothetical protein